MRCGGVGVGLARRIFGVCLNLPCGAVRDNNFLPLLSRFVETRKIRSASVPQGCVCSKGADYGCNGSVS